MHFENNTPDTLSDTDIHIWYAYTPSSQSIISEYAAYLSPEETNRAQRFRFDRDRCSYQFMHGLLRLLLGKYLETPPSDIILSKNAFGKPQICKSSNDRPIGFTMSRSRDVVVFAFAYSRNIGVDVEYINSALQIDDIVPVLFSSEEAAHYENVNECEQQLDYVLRLWTLKEAYVKAKGVGMHEPFEHIFFDFDPKGVPLLRRSLHDHDISQWSVSSVNIDTDYIISLVYDGPLAHISQKQWLPE